MKKGSLSHNQKEWAYARWCEGRTLLEIAMALGMRQDHQEGDKRQTED